MLAPFRAVRYAPERVSGLAEVTSPPYDVVGAAAVGQLRDSDPHNVVRLTLPGAHGAVGRYRLAARTLRQWIAEGVLVPDAAPALYVYEERAARSGWPQPGAPRAGACGDAEAGALQRGLIGAVALSPPAAGIVLPHEDVTTAVVADRRKLMEATEANLEPIFLLYDGGGAASQLVDEIARTREPAIEAVTGGAIHRLWAMTGPAQVAAVAADLARRRAVIADGHHRYAAYLQMQQRRHAAGFGAGPWDYGLALLVDAVAYPPRMDAIHRVVPGLAPATAAELARSAFTVRELRRGTGMAGALAHLRDAAGLADAARAARPPRPRVAFLLAGDGLFRLVTDPDPVRMGAVAGDRSQRWQRLDTSVLHELLIRAIWRISDDQAAVRMVHHDAQAAIEAAGPGGTAVICNPPRVADVLAVAAGGERMPRKSTSFGPKPRTGLVLRSFAYG